MSYAMDPRVDAYIDALPDWQLAICREVRHLVHAADKRGRGSLLHIRPQPRTRLPRHPNAHRLGLPLRGDRVTRRVIDRGARQRLGERTDHHLAHLGSLCASSGLKGSW